MIEVRKFYKNTKGAFATVETISDNGDTLFFAGNQPSDDAVEITEQEYRDLLAKDRAWGIERESRAIEATRKSISGQKAALIGKINDAKSIANLRDILIEIVEGM